MEPIPMVAGAILGMLYLIVKETFALLS